jgi:hypothetical protein
MRHLLAIYYGAIFLFPFLVHPFPVAAAVVFFVAGQSVAVVF